MIDVMPQLQSQPQLQLQHQLHLQLPAVRHPCPITVKWSGEEGKTPSHCQHPSPTLCHPAILPSCHFATQFRFRFQNPTPATAHGEDFD
ncbi:uncharacterized protein Dana_GF27369, isoform B [Drosophila ananassae]|uniref:Uncharacterized protein, isoform B n=1 Tax=Drosophila ananassae TaxID=7217 RepID=A0A0P8XXU4_DROAN|nr:uncharacterized protein Dana_GF27369, isoform B [Drosophila ananassae]